MNNRELLIQIILELRSNGIKNYNVLKAVELCPPHYYMSFFKTNIKKNIFINELVGITKILELALSNNQKLENILIIGFNKGWLLYLFSVFARRVYGICENLSQKEKLENIYIKNKYKNIYLNIGNSILSWKKVSPFDFILSLKCINDDISLASQFLTESGIAYLVKKKKNNTKYIIQLDSLSNYNKTKLNFNLLENSELL